MKISEIANNYINGNHSVVRRVIDDAANPVSNPVNAGMHAAALAFEVYDYLRENNGKPDAIAFSSWIQKYL